MRDGVEGGEPPHLGGLKAERRRAGTRPSAPAWRESARIPRLRWRSPGRPASTLWTPSLNR